MRFPSPCSNEEEKEEEEDERKGEAEVEDGEKDAEGGEGRAPLPLESTTVGSGEKGRKHEEVSLNLGMGMGLIFLLARSATQFNKMVELREQMEMLLKDIKDELQRKEIPPNYTEPKYNIVSSASNGNISNCISLQSDKASYDLQRLQNATRSAA